MKEIKFRAWAGEQMIVVDSNSSYTITFGNEKAIISMFSNGGEFVCDSKAEEVMQYTGKKDKNGVDIFQHDLMQNESGRISQVVWNNHAGCWDAEVVKAVGNSVGGYARDWSRCMEVIGNIHQNTELMCLHQVQALL